MPQHTETYYKRNFYEAFPDQLVRAIVSALIDAYRASIPATRRALDAPERHDGLGMIRRGKIHESLRGVAERFALRHENQPNETGSHYFLSIFSGKFRLVAYLAGAGQRYIRPSHLRELWARHNRDEQNIELFASQHETRPVPDDATYLAFLVHWPRRSKKDQPAAAHIVVPDETLRKRLFKIDLFVKYPQIANAIVSVPARQPRTIRPRKTKKEGQQGA